MLVPGQFSRTWRLLYSVTPPPTTIFCCCPLLHHDVSSWPRLLLSFLPLSHFLNVSGDGGSSGGDYSPSAFLLRQPSDISLLRTRGTAGRRSGWVHRRQYGEGGAAVVKLLAKLHLEQMRWKSSVSVTNLTINTGRLEHVVPADALLSPLSEGLTTDFKPDLVFFFSPLLTKLTAICAGM